MIMGGVGENVHLVLGDRMPLARPDVLADHAEQVSRIAQLGDHRAPIRLARCQRAGYGCVRYDIALPGPEPSMAGATTRWQIRGGIALHRAGIASSASRHRAFDDASYPYPFSSRITAWVPRDCT